MAALTVAPEKEVILVEMSDETRRLAEELAGRRLDRFLGESCCICDREMRLSELRLGAQLAGVGRNGNERIAHVVCWQGFVELLQTLPAEWLHRLITAKEDNQDGQVQVSDKGGGE
jgi:hypothetical protein